MNRFELRKKFTEVLLERTEDRMGLEEATSEFWEEIAEKLLDELAISFGRMVRADITKISVDGFMASSGMPGCRKCPALHPDDKICKACVAAKKAQERRIE